MVDEARVAIGVVVRAHGLGGEVRVKPFNPESKLLQSLESVHLRAKDGVVRVVPIVRVRRAAADWLVVFEGATDRDGAEALRGSELEVPRSMLPPLPEDEVYLADLIGLEVYDADVRLGVVDAYFEYPSVDCLRVVGDHGVRELPLLDAYVAGIDVDARRILATRTDELPVERPTSKR